MHASNAAEISGLCSWPRGQDNAFIFVEFGIFHVSFRHCNKGELAVDVEDVCGEYIHTYICIYIYIYYQYV